MKRICNGCGSEIPEDSDFCYACGAWADRSLIVNDDGTMLYSPVCLNCGEKLVPDAKFCQFCGAKTSEMAVPIRNSMTSFDKKDIIAIILAIVPGLFNIFGLGQIVQKRWSKAFVYLCSTILLIYITPSLITVSTGYFVLIAIQVFFFVLSVMDVYKTALRGGS